MYLAASIKLSFMQNENLESCHQLHYPKFSEIDIYLFYMAK